MLIVSLSGVAEDVYHMYCKAKESQFGHGINCTNSNSKEDDESITAKKDLLLPKKT